MAETYSLMTEKGLQGSSMFSFPGSYQCPEGGAVWVSGGSDVGADEEHGPVRRLGAQSLHEGVFVLRPPVGGVMARTYLTFIKNTDDDV